MHTCVPSCALRGKVCGGGLGGATSSLCLNDKLHCAAPEYYCVGNCFQSGCLSVFCKCVAWTFVSKGFNTDTFGDNSNDDDDTTHDSSAGAKSRRTAPAMTRRYVE